MGTFCVSDFPSHFYQGHPAPHSNTLSSILLFLAFITIWSYLLIYLLTQENMNYMSLVCFSSLYPQGLQEDMHIAGIPKSVQNEHFIFPVSSSGKIRCLTHLCIPHSGQYCALYGVIVPKIATDQIKCHFLFFLGQSEKTPAVSKTPRNKKMCTVSFSPHLHSTVWEHILRRGQGFQHIPQRTVAMGTSSVPVKGISNWCGS